MQAQSQYLQNYLLMYSKFGDDVCQKQMSAVFARWVHTGLGEQARPSKRHQAPQFAVPVFVVVMNVMWRVLNQKCGKLQEIYPERIQHVSLFFRIKYLGPPMIREERRKVRKNKTKQKPPTLLSIKAKSYHFCFWSVF